MMTHDFAKLCFDLVSIPSVSHDETAIASFVESELVDVESLSLFRIGNNVIAKSWSGRPERVVIAGHLDTVPPDGNETASIEGGRLRGLGSADMKSGLSVMIALAKISGTFDVDTTFVFYACEEVASKFSGLKEICRYDASMLVGSAAILMEPTSARIEGGCQGTLRVRMDVAGRRAHTARPWAGMNAIHRLGELISRAVSLEQRQPVIDGLVYQESLQAVSVEGGVAGNVVPDKASVVFNYRFAPDKDLNEAYSSLISKFEDLIFPEQGDSLDLVEGAEGALPNLDNPRFATLREFSGLAPKPKLGWTDVAFFDSIGVPAVNFGPGNPLLAHTSEEYVEIGEMDLVYEVMCRTLGSTDF